MAILFLLSLQKVLDESSFIHVNGSVWVIFLQQEIAQHAKKQVRLLQRRVKNRRCNLTVDNHRCWKAPWEQLFSVCWQSVRLWQILAIFGTWHGARRSEVNFVITGWRTDRTSEEGLKWKRRCCTFLVILQGDQSSESPSLMCDQEGAF